MKIMRISFIVAACLLGLATARATAQPQAATAQSQLPSSVQQSRESNRLADALRPHFRASEAVKKLGADSTGSNEPVMRLARVRALWLVGAFRDAQDELDAILTSPDAWTVPSPKPMNVPLAVTCSFWRATLCRHTGDLRTARNKYQSIIDWAADNPSRASLALVANIYLAETYSASGEIAKATSAIAAAQKALDRADAKTFPSPSAVKDWLAFQKACIAGQPEEADKARIYSKYRQVEMGTLASWMLRQSGITATPRDDVVRGPDFNLWPALLDQAWQSSSAIDRTLADAIWTSGLVDPGEQSVAVIERLRRCAQSRSFVAPEAFLSLIRLEVKAGKKEEAETLAKQAADRYPTYQTALQKALAAR